MDMDTEYVNGRKVVKKHVATIHCCNKLSLLERKISNALLYHAFPNLTTSLEHEITVESLKKLLSFNSKNTLVLKKALKTLVSTIIEWNLLNENVEEIESFEGWNASTILSSVSVNKGIIRYQYSELLKQLIVDPKMYGRISLIIQARFKSAYSLVLYENCVRYRGLPYTKNFNYRIFRKLLGVEDGKYETFRDFNRRVLTPAVTEINRSSDIQVVPEITRKARKVQSIKFSLQERPIKRRIGQSNHNTVKTRLVCDFVENDLIANFITVYGKEPVEKAINYIKRKKSYQRGEIKNFSGYLSTVLKNGYQESKLQTGEATATSHAKNILNEIEQEVERERYKVQKMLAIYSDLKQEDQELMNLSFTTNGGSLYQYAEPYIKMAGFSNIIVFENGFAKFLSKEFSDFFDV